MFKTITIAPREALLKRDYIDDLATSVSQIPLSRRGLMEGGTQAFYDWIECGGRIFTGEGEPIQIYPGVFDDAHSPNSDGEWISDLRRRGQDARSGGLGKPCLGACSFTMACCAYAGGLWATRRVVPESRRCAASFAI